MAFFSEAEAERLRVARMILHVVGGPEATFTPQREVDVQEEGFFRARILAETGDAVHQFDESSLVRPILERMAREETTFQQGGQELAALFARDHVKQATRGAFFVFELDVGDASKIYALIKYDYREVVELAQAEGRNVLRAILQAFVKERKAVQKICVARVVAGTAEASVAAADRMQAAPDLTDYFARFLGVFRSRSDAELSNRLQEALRATLSEVRDHLPSGGVPAALRKAKQALQPRDPVTNDDVVDAMLHAAGRPDDETMVARIQSKTMKHLRRQKLEDVSFTPEQRIFQTRQREWINTAEEVRLEYPAEQMGQSVTREQRGEFTVFTITTKQIVGDGTLPDRTRQSR